MSRPLFASYDQAMEYLFRRVNYERLPPRDGVERHFKLGRMRRLLQLLGDPHLDTPTVHIAGTKGKGSTATMIASILCACGFRVGLFTSPHLNRFEERLRINDRLPAEQEMLELIAEIAQAAAVMENEPRGLSPTYFEMATAMAWLHFRRNDVDWAVMEVGLGGRLDATNLCRPSATVITSISRDHTELLGETVEEIAGEKAGIIKPDVPIVSGVHQSGPRSVIERVSHERRAPLSQIEFDFRAVADDKTGVFRVDTPVAGWPSLSVPLAGDHQIRNAAVAVTVVDLLSRTGDRRLGSADRFASLSADTMRRGLSNVRLPLRIEPLQVEPMVIVDSAHNEASVAALLETVRNRPLGRRGLLIFATSIDKDARAMLAQLIPEFDAVLLTRYLGNPRSTPIAELESIVRSLTDRQVIMADDPESAWQQARNWTDHDDWICVTGSFFIAGEMREVIRTAAKETPPITTEF